MPQSRRARANKTRCIIRTEKIIIRELQRNEEFSHKEKEEAAALGESITRSQFCGFPVPKEICFQLLLRVGPGVTVIPCRAAL